MVRIVEMAGIKIESPDEFVITGVAQASRQRFNIIYELPLR